MKVIGGRVNKMRVLKMGMTVIPRRLNIVVKSCQVGRRLFPRARFRPGRAVIKIMVHSDGRLVSFELRFVHGHKAARPRIDDVVRENIVRHVPLHLELTGPCSGRIVVVERVVDDGAVLGVSTLRRITSDGNSRGVSVIDEVISCRDVTGSAVLVLTGQLDPKVHIVNDVLFDQGPSAAVHINTVGRFIVAVGWIAARSNVVNQIAAYHSVASLVNGRVGRRALETDDVDSDVVVVVDHGNSSRSR